MYLAIGLVCGALTVFSSLMASRSAYNLGQWKMKEKVLEDVFAKETEYRKHQKLDPRTAMLLLEQQARMLDRFSDIPLVKR